MRRTVLAILLAGLLSVVTFADESAPATPDSSRAVEAQRRHDVAIKEAREKLYKAIIVADQQYIAELDAGLKAAMHNEDIDSARALDDQKKAAELVLKRDEAESGAADNSAFEGDIKDITMVDSAVHEQARSLDLNQGAQVYIYGMDAGAGHPSEHFIDGTKISVQNGSDNLCAELAVSHKPHNEFSTDCAYETIGGFGVKGYRHLQAIYASDNRAGVSSVAIKFTLNAPAMVAVVALAAAQSAIQLNGPDQLIIDAHAPNAADSVPMTIAHALLQPGDYVITERSQFIGADTQQGNRGDLMGLFVCSEANNAVTSDSPTMTLPDDVASPQPVAP